MKSFIKTLFCVKQLALMWQFGVVLSNRLGMQIIMNLEHQNIKHCFCEAYILHRNNFIQNINSIS